MVGRHRKIAGSILSGAVGAGICAEIVRRYRRDLGRARARISRGSRIAKTSFGPIEYASIGDGPPVLVVHGAGGGFDQGLDLGRALARSGFRVIAVSRFGYLGTPLPSDSSAEAQADAHAALFDSLGVRRAAVMGVSAGAPSSVQLALRHTERVDSLVLVVPGLYAPRPGTKEALMTPPRAELLIHATLGSDFLFWAAIRWASKMLTRAILGTPPQVVEQAPPEERARVAEMLEHILPLSQRRLGLLNDAEVISHLRRYPLERIETPVLAISVQDDLYGTYDSARYTAEHVPRARFLGFPSGGHLLVGHNEEMSAVITEFLSETAVRPISKSRSRKARGAAPD